MNNQNIILLSIGIWFVIILRCLNTCQAAGLVCNSNSSLPSIWIRNRCQNRLVKNNFEMLLSLDKFSQLSNFVSDRFREKIAKTFDESSLLSFASDRLSEYSTG